MTIETLEHIVFRLANQSPVRYWLDARGDQSYSHVAIEVYTHSADSIKFLSDELELRYGCTLAGYRWAGDCWAYKFEAPREK